MTNNPTIDGVPLELVERVMRMLQGHGGWGAADELRALLDAPVVEPASDLREHCKQCAEVVKTWPEWKRSCLGGSPVVERQPEALSVPDECPHLIVFDDNDRENLLFAGDGARSAALKTWEKISASWNAHLFVRIERNCRDDRYPSAEAYTATSEVAALESTIAQLQAENGRIKARLCVCRDCGGQGEVYSGHDSYQGHYQPPEPDMDVCGTCGGDGVLGPLEDFEALAADRDQLQARIAELESGRGEPIYQLEYLADPGWRDASLHEFGVASKLKGYRVRTVYTAPPAPVAVVLPERDEFEKWIIGEWPTAPIRYVRDALPEDDPLHGTYCDEYLQRAWVGWQARACLDATAVLNGIRSTVHVGDLDPAQRLALARGERE